MPTGLIRYLAVRSAIPAAIVAAAFIAAAPPANATTVPELKVVDLHLLDDGAAYAESEEVIDWFEQPGDEWSGEDWIDVEYLVDYDEQIAWSGVPTDDDGMMYTTGDWVKRGPGDGALAPVPLPGAGLLLLGGLAGLAAVRRRR